MTNLDDIRAVPFNLNTVDVQRLKNAPLSGKNPIEDKNSDPFKKEKSFEDTLNDIPTAALQQTSPVHSGSQQADASDKSSEAIPASSLSPAIPTIQQATVHVPVVKIDSDSTKNNRQSPHQWGVQG